MLILLIVIGLVVVGGLFVMVGLHRLRTQRVSVDEAFAGIDVQLTRRAELIPNLVETVKGYAAHERETLQRVVEARARAVASTGRPSSRARAVTTERPHARPISNRLPRSSTASRMGRIS